MNCKKAKRLRQLVEHLQVKGALETKEWAIYSEINHRAYVNAPPPTQLLSLDASHLVLRGQGAQMEMHMQRVLDANCGKAIYKQMKKRALTPKPQ